MDAAIELLLDQRRHPMLSRFATWIIEKKHGARFNPPVDLHANLERLKELSQSEPHYPQIRRVEDNLRYHDFVFDKGRGKTRDLFTKRGFVSVAHTVLDKNTEFPPHDHKEQEVVIVIQGTLFVQEGENIHMLAPGGVINMQPASQHSAVSPTGCEFICVSIPDSPDFPATDVEPTPPKRGEYD